MMICDRDGIDSLGAAGGNKLLGVLATFIVGNGTCAPPVDVARGMHLKIALVKMSAFIHTMPCLNLFRSRYCPPTSVFVCSP